MSRLSFVEISNLEEYNGFEAGRIALRGMQEGLNVLYAPNASGKSTLASMLVRALGFEQRRSFLVKAVVREGDEVRTERVERRAAAFRPKPERPARYHLDVVKLLEGLSKDEGVDDLQRIVSDGVHFIAENPSGFKGTLNAVSLARKELSKESAEATKARGIEAELPERKELLSRLERMGPALAFVRTALENKRHIEACTRLQETLDALESEFPGIKNQGEEWLQSFDSAYRDWRSACEEHGRVVEECKRMHRDGSLPTRSEPEPALARTRKLAGSASHKVSELRRADASLEEAIAKEQAALAAFCRFCGDKDAWSCLSPEVLDQLRSILLYSDSERKSRSTIEGYKLALDRFIAEHPELDAQAVQKHKDCVENLTAWLSSSESLPTDRRPVWLLLLALAGAVATALPLDWLWRVGIGAIVALAAVAVYLGLGPKQAEAQRRQQLEQFWQGFEHGPSDRTEASVVKALGDALQRLSESMCRSVVRQHLAIMANQKVDDDRFKQLVEESGLALTDPYQTTVLFDSHRAAVEAFHQKVKCESECERLRREIQELRGDLAQTMRTSGFEWDDHADPDSVQIQFEGWHRSNSQRLESELRAQQTRQKVEEWLKLVQLEDLEPEAAWVAVHSRTEQAKWHREAAQELEQTKRDEQNTRVSEHELLAAVALAELPVEGYDLEQVKVRLEQALEQRHNVRDRIHDDETWLAAFRESKQMVEKELKYSKAIADLRKLAFAKAKSEVCDVLRSVIRERVAREAAPKMIRLANEKLHKTSQGRYKLQIPDEPTKTKEELGPLAVWDEIRQQSHLFKELSTGTKVHAVMALKLGWIKDAEEAAGSPQYPLIVDEPMVVSDKRASLAIAELLAEEAKHRQVIVFTNQPEDVVMLREANQGELNELRIEGAAYGSAEADAISAEQGPELPPEVAQMVFKLEVPIESHAPAAVLPSDEPFPEEFGTVRHLLASHGWAQERYGSLVEAMSAVRTELLGERWKPLLQPDALRSSGLTMKKLELAQTLLTDLGGDLQSFLNQFTKTKGLGADSLAQVRTWAEKEGHLLRRAPAAKVRSWAGQHLDPEKDKEDLEWLMKVFRAHIGPEAAE